jgi:cyclopropane-fatty-acyl-phospholipid synthase
MAGSAFGFETGRLGLYQSLLVKSGRQASRLPLTRDDWYQQYPGGYH